MVSGLVYSQDMRVLSFITIFLASFATLAGADELTNATEIAITKSWSQEPGGWTYPMSILVPTGEAPTGGFPVCILLHGNGGNGTGLIGQFANLLPCHALVAPTGYLSSWNICGENSDAPDVDMIDDLVEILQAFTNVDHDRIRIVGFSNGSALANSVLIANTNPGLDAVCAVVSHLAEAQYHDDAFHVPSGLTDPGAAQCGYDLPVTPISGRRYLCISNENDPIIPYEGGDSPVGLSFLAAQDATYLVARQMGFEGSQITGPGEPLGSNVHLYSYLSGRVEHLRGFSSHSMNQVQQQYIPIFLEDCVQPPDCPADVDGNGVVGGGDLAIILGFWGTVADPPGSGYDLNADGIISGADLSIVLGFWGPCDG